MKYIVRTYPSPISEKELNELYWDRKWRLVAVTLAPGEVPGEDLVQYVHYFETHFTGRDYDDG